MSPEEQKIRQEFMDMAEILVDHPDMPMEIIQAKLQMKEAKRTVEKIDKVRTLALQKRLMDAYYSDPVPTTLLKRVQNLPKPIKGTLVLMLFWTLYVGYRTVDYHQFLGSDLSQWQESDFLVNWLGMPAVAAAIYFAWQWIVDDKRASKVPMHLSSTEQFEMEIKAWEKNDADNAVTLIRLVLEQNHKAVYELITRINPDHFDSIVEYVRVMKKPPMKRAS